METVGLERKGDGDRRGRNRREEEPSVGWMVVQEVGASNVVPTVEAETVVIAIGIVVVAVSSRSGQRRTRITEIAEERGKESEAVGNLWDRTKKQRGMSEGKEAPRTSVPLGSPLPPSRRLFPTFPTFLLRES